MSGQTEPACFVFNHLQSIVDMLCWPELSRTSTREEEEGTTGRGVFNRRVATKHTRIHSPIHPLLTGVSTRPQQHRTGEETREEASVLLSKETLERRLKGEKTGNSLIHLENLNDLQTSQSFSN